MLTRALLELTNLACARQNFHTLKSETALDHKSKIQTKAFKTT